MKNKNRCTDIDILRGIGIVLMIANHAYVGKLADVYIHSFHMPLWFVISGYFCNTSRSIMDYVKNRFITILIPYMSFGLLYCGLGALVGNNQWLGFIFPASVQIPYNGALWFLPALFISSTLSYVLIKVFNKKTYILVVLFIAILSSVIKLPSLPLAMTSAFVGCGFFMIGVLLKKYGKRFLELGWLQFAIGMIIVTILVYLNGSINMRTNMYNIVPLFWVNAILMIVVLWNGIRIMLKKFPRLKLEVLQEIGRESIIYVCTNQMLLYVLRNLTGNLYNFLPGIVVNVGYTICIIVIGFWLNRLLRKSPLKIILGIR